MAGSGYNQSPEQITAGLYRIVLTMTNTTYYPSASGTTTQNGSVNPYDWTSSAYTNATSMTATQATYLAQGNLRWSKILDGLDNVTDCRLLDVVVSGNTSGTDATTQPTGIAFTVEFYRDGFVTGEWNAYLKSIGQSSSGTYTNSDGIVGTAYVGIGGTAITTTALAIQDIVTNAIMAATSRGYRVWSPSQQGDSQQKISITAPNATASNIFGTVAVTQISGTTIAGTPL